MNPAEEIVKFWLQQNGYFVMSSIRVPTGQGREIDILAIHEKENKRKHVEVSVSVRMQVFGTTTQEHVARFVKKFDHHRVVDEVQRKFHENPSYTKELVIGDMQIGGRDVFEEFAIECEKSEIKVVSFAEILREVVSGLGGHTHLNPIVKTVQLCKKFMPCVETKV